MADWVLAAERAYVAAAVASHRAAPQVSAPTPVTAAAQMTAATRVSATVESDAHARAIAAAGAIASRYLAVGTPRSFGIVVDAITQVDAAQLALVAHRTWFAPRDVRCAAVNSGAAELAAATGGRVVSVEEALACDIVNVYAADLHIAPSSLRRGTHVNTLRSDVLDAELPALATIVHEAGLPALAAGLVDGRQLDEITIFVVGDAPIAATS
jgi:hypothetical protein